MRKNGYGLNLNLLTMDPTNRVFPYPRRSEASWKSDPFRPIYHHLMRCYFLSKCVKEIEVYEGAYRAIILHCMSICEWVMARQVVVLNGHQQETCYDEIRPCAQNTYIIAGSIVDMIGVT